MSNISMVEARLPPGFRFHPRDEELVCDYLMKKAIHYESLLMIEVDLNKCEPWDIPGEACVGGKEWYFYNQRDRKYATGLRTNRATASGYWKATGKDKAVYHKGTLVGMRKTLVFYQGRAPKGRKSNWVMHEFRLEGPLSPAKSSCLKKDWVLCRVFFKNRDVEAKPTAGMGISWCTDDAASSFLPPLMDSYITFGQTKTCLDEFEQVPCFSPFSQNQTSCSSILTNINGYMEPNTPAKSSSTPQMPMNPSLEPSDKKIINALLNQLTKMDGNLHVNGSSNLGESSSESYISDVCMPNMWNNNY